MSACKRMMQKKRSIAGRFSAENCYLYPANDKKLYTIMELRFNITYVTSFGERLILNIMGCDGQSMAERHDMETADGREWTCRMEMAAKPGSYIDYYYSVERRGAEARREWDAMPHRLEFANSRSALHVMHDRWIDVPDDALLYSAAFTECVARRERQASTVADFAKMLRLKVRAPQLRSGQRLAVTGDDPCLGQWLEAAPLPMAEHTPCEWVVGIDASRLARPVVEFKFVIVGSDGTGILMWEDGPNRSLALPAIKAGEVVTYELPQPSFALAPWRVAGTVVPVFALRSAGSFGVGDFGDLKAMVDWVAATGQHVLQVLPVNDTTANHTWQDSYPYNAISVYALHPQYTDLRQLPQLKDAARREHYEQLRCELNALPQVDYERVNAAKAAYLRELYAQEWPAVSRRATYRRFFEANKAWLVPYAAFCHYRESFGTPDFTQWTGHESPSAKDLADMGNTLTRKYREVSFWYFVQYNLDAQMRAVHEHARSKRVIMKGDIPIGVSKQSVETWTQPRYFNMDGQAGAPPDAFSVNGQNWGFPTYNWDEMLKDGCAWWTGRLQKMAEYFDAYRIDHILGFFRIWEIPAGAVHGLLGQFVPALGMTRSEIAAYGLQADPEQLARPFITDDVLRRRFGERADEVRRTYLCPLGDGYAMLPDYDTQRKVEAAFKGKDGEADLQLRDGLYSLISNVLFVRDRTDASKFHPRIAAQTDLAYAALTDREKTAFNRLYDDYFYRRHNQFWYNEAMRKLPRLAKATRMLMCAEDLGMVPECVPWAMNNLRILSLEIQSMPKETGCRFARLSHYPYLSVCTISTHDTPTMRAWWDEDSDRAQAYFAEMLHHGGAAPHPMPAWLARDIVERNLMSPSALCIIALQDWLAIDENLRLPDAGAERINVPANPRHYWRYRMHLGIEDLMHSADLSATITALVDGSGR